MIVSVCAIARARERNNIGHGRLVFIVHPRVALDNCIRYATIVLYGASRSATIESRVNVRFHSVSSDFVVNTVCCSDIHFINE